ncbi:TetR/AcrR family transcriptional regulator [Cohnella lupini]|uniref:TetR family transcriptional regulator n=1 Tax=Cohnella lupini TaxID=1294267 RepID=A0A3D9ICM1_9BACL|nr:TetR/AcrR family transcriptional regulator C-terminal domain-containing protein [Cohnella lupini]RED59299.1 TetR family transcriptional regulator [Cohnella lupini]
MVTETKTDRRILRTKEAINKAFLELFTEKELEQITINDISERANVNRGTIYLHYTDKYDLLDKCIEDHLSNMFVACSVSIDFNRDKIDLIDELTSVFDYFEANFLFFSAMISTQRTSVFRERMLQIVVANLNEKLDQRDIHRSMNKELIVQFTASAFVGTTEWWIRNHMPHSPQYMAEQLWKLFEKHDVYAR